MKRSRTVQRFFAALRRHWYRSRSNEPVRRHRLFLSGCLLGFLFVCCAVGTKSPDVLVSSVKLYPDYEPSDVVFRPTLTDPCRYEVEMICGMDSIQSASPSQLEELADSLRVSVVDLPLVYLWTAEPVDRTGQRDIRYLHIQPDIGLRFEDRRNGNRIRFWDLSSLIQGARTLQLSRRFQYTCYRVEYEIDSSKVGVYNQSSEFYRFYTRPERWLEYDGAVADTARRIIGRESNPYLCAQLLFNWLKDHGVYRYPPEQRGATVMLQTLAGDCGQFAYLFIALCRSVGIPARLVAGFQATDDLEWGYHAWAECFIPKYGWVPADLTEDCAFGELPNNRLTSSVGMNIPLPRAPRWANYRNSDVEGGVTDYMQMATIVRAGLAGQRFSNIHMIKAKPLEP